MWQSNLHTYDASQFETKSALASSGCETSAASSSKQSSASDAKSNDLSIRIDPRQSLAYQALDEDFQVLDSRHLTPTAQDLDLNPRSASPRLF